MRQGVFVAPEDVGDYLKRLFTDRVRKRERYLEWAAEVTGAIDLNQLQAPASGASGSLLNPTAPSASHVAEKKSQVPTVPPPRAQQSQGRDYASAAVVTSAPLRSHPPAPPVADLAATSLMDEDEDIPTQVAAEAHLQEAMNAVSQGGASPAWGSAPPRRDADEPSPLESTIALPDTQPPNYASAAPGYPQQQPYGNQQVSAEPDEHRTNQAVIETKMNLPRPAAAAQYLAEQGDLSIPGPRSTPVLVAIALLATLCVMGVGALVIYKLRLPPQSVEPNAAVAVPTTPGGESRRTGGAPEGATSSLDQPAPEKVASPGKAPAAASAATPDGGDKPVASAAPSAAAAESVAPGRLTIECKPACDSVVAAGRSLGPSPVVGATLPPGPQRVTVKRGAQQKTIVVTIASGQLTTQTVTM
jgi:serine/threonine-protein kinase